MITQLMRLKRVVFDANNQVVQIGKIITEKNDVYGEFIGMLKLSAKGAEIFKKHFHRAKKLYWGKKFQRAKSFQKAYITDFIQEMVELVCKFIVLLLSVVGKK